MTQVKIRAALYARVSSEKQAKQNTIGSQLAHLRERIAADGLALLEDHGFVDDGHSGSTLMRPALERLPMDRTVAGPPRPADRACGMQRAPASRHRSAPDVPDFSPEFRCRH